VRAEEFLSEAIVGVLKNINGFEVAVNDHSFARLKQRSISPNDIDQALKKLPNIKNEVSKIESGQQFYIHDKSSNICLGMRMGNRKDNINVVYLNTAIKGLPRGDRNPIIDLL